MFTPLRGSERSHFILHIFLFFSKQSYSKFNPLLFFIVGFPHSFVFLLLNIALSQNCTTNIMTPNSDNVPSLNNPHYTYYSINML